MNAEIGSPASRFRSALAATFDGVIYDITEPFGAVEIVISEDRDRLWVSINSVYVLRMQGIKARIKVIQPMEEDK